MYYHPSPVQGETVSAGDFYLEWDYINWIADSLYRFSLIPNGFVTVKKSFVCVV